MSLTAYPGNPQVNGTALIVLSDAPPNVAVQWSLVGAGAILARSACTDERGVAGAVYYPPESGGASTVVISVTRGV